MHFSADEIYVTGLHTVLYCFYSNTSFEETCRTDGYHNSSLIIINTLALFYLAKCCVRRSKQSRRHPWLGVKSGELAVRGIAYSSRSPAIKHDTNESLPSARLRTRRRPDSAFYRVCYTRGVSAVSPLEQEFGFPLQDSV